MANHVEMILAEIAPESMREKKEKKLSFSSNPLILAQVLQTT